MIVIYCRTCSARQTAATTQVESIHRSAEGLVGYVRCAVGHLVIHQFVEAYPKPSPPPTVLALRARLAAEAQVADSGASGDD